MTNKVASKALREKILKVIKEMLMAKRYGYVRKEQAAYEKLEKICEKNNMDFHDTLEKGREYLRKTSVNPLGLDY